MPRDVTLFVGDSFTLGFGVDDGLEFPRLVGARLGEPIINMGIGGSGNARWLRLLRDEAPQFTPRRVVLQVCSNDVDDNLSEGLATLREDGTIAEHAPPPPGYARKIQRVVDAVPGLAYSHLLGCLRELDFANHHGPTAARAGAEDSAPPGLPLTLALVEESIRLCRQRNWSVYLFSADMTADQAKPFAELGERLAVPFLRLPAKAEAPSRYFTVDGHWNAVGHREAADRLVELLSR